MPVPGRSQRSSGTGCRARLASSSFGAVLAVLLAAVLPATGCASSDGAGAGDASGTGGVASEPGRPWAWEAEAWTDALEALADEHPFKQSVYYSPDAVHDAVMLSGEAFYREGRHDVIAMQMKDVEAEWVFGPVYLDVGGAARAVTLEYPPEMGGGSLASMTDITIGDEGIERLTHQRGTWYAERTTWASGTEESRAAAGVADDAAGDYVQAWSTGNEDLIRRIYAYDAIVDDRVRAVTVAGHDAILVLAQESSTPLRQLTLGEMFPASVMSDDPHPDSSTPAVFFDMEPALTGPLTEVWVPVRSKAACPGHWMAALTLNAEHEIVHELRYSALESLRACDAPADLADGWWTGRDLPRAFGERVTGALDTRAGSVEIRNGTPSSDALVQWAFDRFATAGLPAPTVASIRFDPFDARCTSFAGYADWGDGMTSILICFDSTGIGPPRLRPGAETSDDLDEPSTPTRGHLVLHELSHAWLVDHTDRDTREAFVTTMGLDTWNDPETAWSERGVEWAAEVLVWGVEGLERLPINLGSPPCQTITTGYHILTGSEPVTSCPPT